MSIKILDCTLRDGGYINNWAFQDKHIEKIIGSLIEAKVDIVECGYLNNCDGTSTNSTKFDSIESIESKLRGNDNVEKVLMINLGEYEIQDLPQNVNNKIDGIRLAFHKKDLTNALIVSKKIIEQGYKLYFQPMITKNYKDIEFLSMIEKVNKLSPHAFYIVDSFGSMNLNEFNRYLVLSDNNLDKNIILGYHSHNNMQLAFSNAISMCNYNFSRDIIIDSSIYGIGRGAGNLNTELITDYLNGSLGRSYNTLPLLEVIDEYLSSLMKKNSWGFSPAQYLSASFNCHPNYATYLINKNTSHIVGLKKVLEKLPDEKKASFDEEYIEKLYMDYQLQTKSEPKGTLDLKSDKNILLIASGKSVLEFKKTIKEKSESNNYILISLNHISDIECDFYLFTNQKRYDEFNQLFTNRKIVITSNVFSKSSVFSVLDFKKLSFINEQFTSNVALIALNYCISQNIKKVEIAGLDGYKLDTDNYNYKETSVIVDNKELLAQNSIIQNGIDSLKNQIDMEFLTPSIFNQD